MYVAKFRSDLNQCDYYLCFDHEAGKYDWTDMRTGANCFSELKHVHSAVKNSREEMKPHKPAFVEIGIVNWGIAPRIELDNS